MNRKIISVLLILAAVAGIVGAGLSVGMLIRAVQWSEWGRVILYSVTMVVCVEMTVLSIVKLRSKESS